MSGGKGELNSLNVSRRSVMRYLTLGGIGLLVWNAIWRSGDVCVRVTTSCDHCRLLANCQVPKARAVRKAAGTIR